MNNTLKTFLRDWERLCALLEVIQNTYQKTPEALSALFLDYSEQISRIEKSFAHVFQMIPKKKGQEFALCVKRLRSLNQNQLISRIEGLLQESSILLKYLQRESASFVQGQQKDPKISLKEEFIQKAERKKRQFFEFFGRHLLSLSFGVLFCIALITAFLLGRTYFEQEVVSEALEQKDKSLHELASKELFDKGEGDVFRRDDKNKNLLASKQDHSSIFTSLEELDYIFVSAEDRLSSKEQIFHLKEELEVFQEEHKDFLNADRKPEEFTQVWIEFLRRSTGLLVYEEHTSLLPTEVLASQGSEEPALGMTFFYLLSKLGLPLEEVFLKRIEKEQVRYFPLLKTFAQVKLSFEEEQLISFHELFGQFIEALLQRELHEETLGRGFEKVLQLYLKHQEKINKEDSLLQQSVERLLTLQAARSLEHDILLRKIIGYIDIKTIPPEHLEQALSLFKDKEKKVFLEQLYTSFPQHIDEEGISFVEYYAQALLEDGLKTKDAHFISKLFLEAYSLTPKRKHLILAQLELFQLEATKITIAEIRYQAGERDESTLITLALEAENQAQPFQALALYLLLFYQEFVFVDYGPEVGYHVLALAMREEAWAQAQEILELAYKRWPYDALFNRFEVELLLNIEQQSEALNLLRRYLEAYPSDLEAQNRLFELGISDS